MRVRAQNRAMPNVLNMGNVVKQLIWTRVPEHQLLKEPIGENECQNPGRPVQKTATAYTHAVSLNQCKHCHSGETRQSNG